MRKDGGKTEISEERMKKKRKNFVQYVALNYCFRFTKRNACTYEL